MNRSRYLPGQIIAALIVVAFSMTTYASTKESPENTSVTNVMSDATLQSLDEAKSENHGPLSRQVLEFLTVMDSVVNMEKQPAITAEDWAPLGELVDMDKFHRVGNFGEHVNWQEYVDLLVRWANSSWWKGYIFRLREIPATSNQPGLVYLESEERSNQDHPVREDGDYSTLPSIAVYQFDENGKINALRVYDQRPL